jgi:hypothetical protein
MNLEHLSNSFSEVTLKINLQRELDDSGTRSEVQHFTEISGNYIAVRIVEVCLVEKVEELGTKLGC